LARATIQDVAKAADMSVSTVNRALHEPEKVREHTLQLVLQAAESVGFYGIGSIKEGLKSSRPKVRIGLLLMQRNRHFYKSLAKAFEDASLAVRDHEILIQIDYQDELSPQNVADRLTHLAQYADVIGVVAPEHPIVSATIERLAETGKKFFGLISSQTARCNVGYVGLDAWKVGRMAGWVFDNFCKNNAAKIGILVGNHRFRSQEANESGFRSYLREHASNLVLLEPQSTFENSNIAREVTEDMLHKHVDLAGLFVCGGGISGVIAALRDSGRGNDVFVVGYDKTEVTQNAVLDGTINLLISHPLKALAEQAIAAIIRTRDSSAGQSVPTLLLPFEIYTSENI
jgi:LacI family transcriptional regulator